ncbi:MAG TPA: hypothetical protein VII63_12750 [Caulobacteraceae bacterium]
MALSDLASIGSFFSGLAVVVTLLFLLLQMRQANLNQRALMQQMRSARMIDTILRHAEPGLNRVISQAMQGDAEMDDEQIRAFVAAIDATLFNWEDTFLQHKAGTLDAAGLESDESALRDLSVIPAFRVAWKMGRKYFSSGYRDFVDAIMHETKAIPSPNLKSTWNAMMADELATVGGSQ